MNSNEFHESEGKLTSSHSRTIFNRTMVENLLEREIRTDGQTILKRMIKIKIIFGDDANNVGSGGGRGSGCWQ